MSHPAGPPAPYASHAEAMAAALATALGRRPHTLCTCTPNNLDADHFYLDTNTLADTDTPPELACCARCLEDEDGGEELLAAHNVAGLRAWVHPGCAAIWGDQPA